MPALVLATLHPIERMEGTNRIHSQRRFSVHAVKMMLVECPTSILRLLFSSQIYDVPESDSSNVYPCPSRISKPNSTNSSRIGVYISPINLFLE